MDEFQSEKEQVEELKKWWGENGRFVVTGLVLGVAILGGWKYWGDYQIRRAEAASATYEQLLQAVQSGDQTGATELNERLSSEFASTPYSTQAALAMATLHVNKNDSDAAEENLKRVINNSKDNYLKMVARLRLARVQIMAERPEQAIATLNAVDAGEFEPRFHEVRGDAYAQQGQSEQARREYQAALDKFQPGLFDRQFVEMKLNNLAAVDPEA